jgi:Protein of unknown function (DUF2911)
MFKLLPLQKTKSQQIMKKLFFTLSLLLVGVMTQAQIKTPNASPSASVTQEIGLGKATVEYSRPALKGRKMFGAELIPFGKVWRTGANKIPNLILSQDMMIEGKKISAGTYGIATIPNATEWTIIITKNATQWGVYEYKEAEDLMRFNVKVEKLVNKEEYFTMGFSDFTPTSASVVIAWENSQVKFKLSQDPSETIMADIKAKTADKDANTETLQGAANYYLENGKDLNQAMEWANKVVEKDKQYWTLALRAKIAQKLGKCEIAKEDAKVGIELAKKDNDNSYVMMLNKVLATCK